MKNDYNGQRQLFFLLHDFALRICCRYSSIKEDPAIPMYNGFVKLFRNIRDFNHNADLDVELTFKNWFRNIVIDSCIEKEKQEVDQLKDNLSSWNQKYVEVDAEEKVGIMSPKEIIDAVRKLPFYYRMVFNLFVIDGYNIEKISSKLNISVSETEFNLKRARLELEKLLRVEYKPTPTGSLAS